MGIVIPFIEFEGSREDMGEPHNTLGQAASWAVAWTLATGLICGAADAGDVTPPRGAPFCIEQDHLQEYLLAMLKHDHDWMAQLPDCLFFRGGIRIGLSEELPSESAIGHVSKVRVMFRGKSVVGYMLFMETDKQQ